MERRLHVALGLGDGWDPNDLLHPAQAFEHPSHVVNDPDLTLNEKRAFLLRGRPTPARRRLLHTCAALRAGSNRFCSMR
jgi:hypothetical protein